MRSSLSLWSSKKGSSDSGSGFESSSTALYWIFILFPLVIVIVFFVLLFGGYVDSLSPVPDVLEHDLVIARISSTCFTYIDESTNTVQTNIIDLQKFNQTNLDACFATQSQPSISVSLDSLSNPAAFSTKQVYLGGGASQRSYVLYALVHNGSALLPAQLTVAFHE